MKKLLPALSLLIVATIVMVFSTYAWFSMSTQVTASGMQVQATVDSNLLISQKTESNTNASGEATVNASGKITDGDISAAITTQAAATLYPTSSLNGSKWYTATANTLSNAEAKYGTYARVADTDLNNYRLLSEFYIQRYDPESTSSSGSGSLVVESISVSGSDSLGDAFRVMIVCGGNVVICRPTNATEPTNKVVESVSDGYATCKNTEYATVDTVSNGTATISANNLLLDGVVDNEAYAIQVYIYFEGEDPACKTDNIPATLGTYQVTLSFGIVE